MKQRKSPLTEELKDRFEFYERASQIAFGCGYDNLSEKKKSQLHIALLDPLCSDPIRVKLVWARVVF